MAYKLPKIITQAEFEKLFDYVLKKKKPHYKEYALCMLLAFEAGMRISEIVGWKDKVPILTKDSISFERNTIKIISGKGSKDRMVPLPKRVNANALNLLPICVQRRAIQKFITKIGKEVLGRQISLHTFRHGFASHLATHGRPLHELQMLLGHSRLDTTAVYLHTSPVDAVKGARDVF